MALTFWVSTTNLVLILFFLSGPTAIIWFVIAVIVYSIQTFPRWLVSHISQKVSKIFPAVTNLYTPATISMPVFMIWISAALKHGIPATINSISFSKTRISVLDPCLTPATERVSTSQVVSLDNDFIATVTNAIPAGFFSALTRRTYNHKHSETLICQIDFVWHVLNYITKNTCGKGQQYK